MPSLAALPTAVAAAPAAPVTALRGALRRAGFTSSCLASGSGLAKLLGALLDPLVSDPSPWVAAASVPERGLSPATRPS